MRCAVGAQGALDKPFEYCGAIDEVDPWYSEVLVVKGAKNEIRAAVIEEKVCRRLVQCKHVGGRLTWTRRPSVVIR